jgi:hypothetical protein
MPDKNGIWPRSGQRLAEAVLINTLSLSLAAAVVDAAEGATGATSHASSISESSPAAALEEAIRQLGETDYPSQLGSLVPALQRIEDPAERDRLQQLFEQRLQMLLQRDQAAQAGSSAAGELTVFGLLPYVEGLTLGPQATVNDLRARDELVAKISQVPDPVAREQLLKRLEERELQAKESSSVEIEASPE